MKLHIKGYFANLYYIYKTNYYIFAEKFIRIQLENMNLSYQILLNFFDGLDGEALDCGSDKEDSNIQQEGIKSKWILIDLQINIWYIT